MSVQIILSAFDTAASLPREFIQQEMAGSILAQALRDDPNASAITLPSTDVTPHVLQALVNLSQDKDPEKSSLDFIRADRYLNWPLLRAFGSKYYDQLDRKEINRPANQDIFSVALEDDWSIAVYLARKGFDFTYQYQTAVRTAVTRSDAKCVEFILRQKGVDPSSQDNICLDTAIENSHLAITRLLMQNPKVASTFKFGVALYMAIQDSELPEMIREVASWPEPEDEFRRCTKSACHRAIRWAILYNEVNVARHMLQMRQGECTVEYIMLCCEYGRGQILKLLVTSPKLERLSEDRIGDCIREAENRGYYDVVQTLRDYLSSPI